MDPMIRQLLEAHVQHELSRFKSRKHRETIREEVAALFQWIQRVKLRDLITPEVIVGLIARNVVDLPVPAAVTDLAAEMGQRVLSARENRATSIQDICPAQTCADALAKLGSLEGPRRDLIHKLVSSTVYTEQISNALYTGIKEYLLTENVLAQKVPGLASLIKLGKFAVNKTMKPLEAAVEKTVKAYIEANLGNTIRRSEQSINDRFEAAHIVDLGAQIWARVAPIRLSEYFKLIDGEDLADFIAIGHEFWLHFRKTSYFEAIYTDLVRCFFDKYADREISVLADDFGVTEKRVTNELAKALDRGIEAAIANGYLEQRIRARLEDFYRSPQAARVIAGEPSSRAPVKATRKAPATAAIATRKKAPTAKDDSAAPTRRTRKA